jgi:hypothetical protein
VATNGRNVRAIGAALRENLSSVTTEPLPTEFTELLRRLEQAEAASETQRAQPLAQRSSDHDKEQTGR